MTRPAPASTLERSRPKSPIETVGPPPDVPQPRGGAKALTAFLAFGPMLCLGYAVVRLLGHGLATRDALLALALYAITGHGVTIGFHRMLAHRSFTAARPLKIAVVVAGSLAFQGGVIPWVANHRRHHAFADRKGDPHSPVTNDPRVSRQLLGFWHAHTGWLFTAESTSERRYAPDLIADSDLVTISRLFPIWCVASLAVPFAIGWLWTGRVGGGATTLLWAGGVRVAVLHHVTWSVNSVCHTFGKRPFATRDRSTNFAPMAVIAFGESWHNAHHAFPRSARHGVERGQWDSSARLIRIFEQRGWARDVHWTSRTREVA